MIPDRTDALDKLYSERIAHADEVPEMNGHRKPVHGSFSDEQIVELCRNAKNATKFERLFDLGDTSEYGGDESRADQALVSILAFYTQDSSQIDVLFRRSRLYRPEKWGKRPDYRRRTIDRALAGLTETYSASHSGEFGVNRNGNRKTASPSPSLQRVAMMLALVAEKSRSTRELCSKGPSALHYCLPVQ